MEVFSWEGLTGIIAVGTIIFIIGRWIGSVNEHKKAVHKFMDEIRVDIKRIFERLPPQPTVAGNSPLRLTDVGLEISQTLNAKDWALRTADKLKDGLAGKQDYEIQEFCFNYVRKKYKPDDEYDKIIRSLAYKYGIERQAVMDVLVIELRDVLLEQ